MALGYCEALCSHWPAGFFKIDSGDGSCAAPPRRTTSACPHGCILSPQRRAFPAKRASSFGIVTRWLHCDCSAQPIVPPRPAFYAPPKVLASPWRVPFAAKRQPVSRARPHRACRNAQLSVTSVRWLPAATGSSLPAATLREYLCGTDKPN